jgi:hypothetical protein
LLPLMVVRVMLTLFDDVTDMVCPGGGALLLLPLPLLLLVLAAPERIEVMLVDWLTQVAEG